MAHQNQLARKYAQERAKRLRPDMAAQYVDFGSPDIVDLGKDPFVDYETLAGQEPPLKHGSSIKFLIIGGGHNGLLFAYRLIEAGFQSTDICIVDSAGGFGGTWYWNRYPGVMCDVEASIYLPLLEETGYIPKYRYSEGYEILGQSQRIATKWNLRGMFCTKVHSQVWNEEKGRWTVRMTQNRGPSQGEIDFTIQAQFVFGAWGYFYSPRIPKLPGLDQFKARKRVFHTSRWDYKYTGGSQENPALVNLKNKVVGIIGTGATAVQVVPELAKWAKHLYVFQRTPSHCFPRFQQSTNTKSWANEVASKKGWQYERQLNFDRFISDDPAPPVDFVKDGWTGNRAYAGSVGSRRTLVTPDLVNNHIRSMFEIDVEHAERSRAYVNKEVKHPVTAERLKAWYPGWCKRPTFHDGFLSAFNQANVTLVDTNGKGIERYTESGVLANEVEYDLDLLVLATGFSPSSRTSPAERMDGAIIGRDGRSIQDKWKSSDFGTMFGLMTNQFPNMFFYGVSGIGSSPNLTSYYDAIAKLAAHIVAAATYQADGSKKLIVEVTKNAEDEYTDEVEKRSLWYTLLKDCTPGYFNGEGAVAQEQTPEQAKLAARTSGWGSGAVDYHAITQAYMSKAKLEGIELRA